MKHIKLASLLLIFLSSLGIVACNSGSTATEDNEGGINSIFVSTDTSTGDIELNVRADSVAVTETTTFSVHLVDANGSDVPNTRVSCDTEDSLAILEPNSGSFITDSHGSASGVLGCEAPGSFRMACRIPSGGKRVFATVKCTGTVPDGFTGFPGSGGQTLGNGVAGGEESIQITNIDFLEEGVLTAIDISQIFDCDGDFATDDPEGFFDTMVQFSITNGTFQDFTATSYNYTVASGTSTTLPISAVVGAGATASVSSFVFNASGGTKTFIGIPVSLVDGQFSITFRVFGNLADGTPVTLTAATSYNSGVIDNC